jgi:hypothetical protein
MTINFDVASSSQPQLLHRRDQFLKKIMHSFYSIMISEFYFLFWITKMYEEFFFYISGDS